MKHVAGILVLALLLSVASAEQSLGDELVAELHPEELEAMKREWYDPLVSVGKALIGGLSTLGYAMG